jgi:PST family polysaccharide transporter
MFFRHVGVGLISLVGSTILIRELGAALWASYSVAYFITAFVDGVFGANVLGSVVQAPEKPDRRRREAAVAVMQRLAGGLALVVAITAFPAAALYGRDDLAPCLLGAAACIYVYGTRALSSALLERELRYRGVAVGEILDQVLFYAVALPLAFTGHGLTGVAVGIGARGLLTAALLRRLAPVPWLGRPHRDEVRRIVAFALPTLGSALLLLVNGLAAVAILGGGHAAELAFFMTTVTVLGYAATVQVVAQRVAFPALARLQGDVAQLRGALEGTMHMSAVLMTACVVPLAATGPVWLPALFGSEWARAWEPMTFGAAALLIGVLPNIAVASLSAVDRPGDALRLQAGMTATYVISAIALAQVSVLWGVALAYALSRVAGVVYSSRLLHEARLRVPVWRLAAIMLIASCACAAVAVLLAHHDWLPGFGLLLAGAVWWAIGNRARLAILLGWARSAGVLPLPARAAAKSERP